MRVRRFIGVNRTEFTIYCCNNSSVIFLHIDDMIDTIMRNPRKGKFYLYAHFQGEYSTMHRDYYYQI